MVNKNNNLGFGIVQGRLSIPPNNQLQWFPQDGWDREFEIASKLGFNYLELIAERQHNPDNPIWNINGIERISELTENSNLFSHAFCNDYVIDHCLIRNSKVVDQTLNLISKGKLLGCEKLIFPLFEHSELTNSNYKDYRGVLTEIGDAARESKMLLCLETILDGQQLVDVLDDLDHPSIFAVFDTGNRIAFGHDIYSDIILLGDYIKHVHIKDKNENNENVILGTGKVNFHKVFQSLAEIDYNGPYTFETTRGKNPVETAKYNLSLAQFFISDTFRN